MAKICGVLTADTHARGSELAAECGGCGLTVPAIGRRTPTLDDVVSGSSEDVEHLLIRRQRPKIVGHNAFQRVSGSTDRVHLRQQALRVRGLVGGGVADRVRPAPPSTRPAQPSAPRSASLTASSSVMSGVHARLLERRDVLRQLGLVADQPRAGSPSTPVPAPVWPRRRWSARTSRGAPRSGCAVRAR